MEQLVRAGLLYDFYGGLLTAKQRRVLELSYQEDWSLAEIAATIGVSRQAVHDLRQRSEQLLERYEAKLGLAERYLREQQLLENILLKLQNLIASGPSSDQYRKPLLELQRQLESLKETH